MPPRTTSSSSSPPAPPLSLSQQKLYRQTHIHSTNDETTPSLRLPNPAYLLTSKFFDVLSCSTPLLFPSLCPFPTNADDDDGSGDLVIGGVETTTTTTTTTTVGVGGWRSLFPDEWVHFPYGKLSHSFGNFYEDANVLEDLTFGEFYREEQQKQQQQQQQEQLSNMSSSSSISGWTKYLLLGISTPIAPTTTPNATTNHDAFLAQTSHLLTSYYTFAFHTNNTTLSTLTHPSTLFVLSILVLLLRKMKHVLLPKFSSLGQTLGNATHGSGWNVNNQDRIQKFGEYVYRLLYHSAVSIYGVWYFHDKPWWGGVLTGSSGSGGGVGGGGTKHLWMGHPNQVVYPGMAWYYLIQCAYNVDALLSLVELSYEFEFVNPFTYSSAVPFLEREQVVNEIQRKEQVYRMMASSGSASRRLHRRSVLWTPFFRVVWSTNIRGDFREMMAHHLVTNALIFFSSYYRLTRVGSMVFLVHDLSDVPVDMSKLANFVKWKITTIVCFVGMVVMWMVTRLYIFPFVICRAVVLESYDYLVWNGGSLDPAMYNAYYLFFYALLGALVLLHVTWFLILLRIGWTLVSTGERHDYTEHKSGEKQKSN